MNRREVIIFAQIHILNYEYLIVNPLQEPVSISLKETVEASLGAEGGLNGQLSVEGRFEVFGSIN